MSKNDNLADMYYTTFNKKTAELYNGNKQLIRRFTLTSEIINAQVSGSGKECYVAIVCKDGHSFLYKSNGQLVRKG